MPRSIRARLQLCLGIGLTLLGGACASATETWLTWSALPAPPAAVPGAFATRLDDGTLLFAGGRIRDEETGTERLTDRVLAYSPGGDGESGAWIEVGRLPHPWADGASIATTDGLWCVGGVTPSGATDAVVRLVWSAAERTVNLAETGPALPHPTLHPASTRLGGLLYVAGGLVDDLPSAQFLVLDPAEKQWRDLPTWPAPARYGAALVRQGGGEVDELYLMGGDAVGGPEHSAWRFRPSQGIWRTMTAPPQPSGFANAVPLGPAHVLLAGRTGLQAYHTITNRWVELPRAGDLTGTPLRLLGGPRTVAAWSVDAAAMTVAVGEMPAAATHFRAWDYATLGLYLAAIVLIGFAFSKRGGTTDDYFLAGNRIPWWAAGISLMATQVSSIGFMAIPAKTFSTNWVYFLGVFTWFIVVPIVSRFFIPFFRRQQVASAYEFLELRFNVVVRLFAALSFSLMQIARLAIVLLLPALALATVTDLNLVASIMLMGAIATLYTVTGGMAAVVWTDVVQAGVLIGGAVVAIFMVVLRLDGGWGEFWHVAVADDKFRMILPTRDFGVAAAWVVIVGNVFSRLSALTSDQSVIQRYLTTPDVRASRRALWLDVGASVPWAVITFTLGTALYVFYQAHPAALSPAVDTNSIVPLFIAQAMPPGIAGLLIAAIFAAAMSSLDSSMHSTATVIVSDFYIRFVPRSAEGSRLWLAKGTVMVLGAFGTLAAIYLAHSGAKSLWDQFIAWGGLFVGVLAGLFLLGVFTRRPDGWDALIGAFAGAALTLWVSRYTRVSFFLYPAIGVSTCFLVGCLASAWPRHRRQPAVGAK